MTSDKSGEIVSPTSTESAAACVREIVDLLRNRGVKVESAVVEVADILGMTPKRLKKLLYRDGYVRLAEQEAALLDRHLAACIDEEIAKSLQYIEALRAKRKVVECKKANYSQHGSGCSSVATLSGAAA